MRKLFNFLRKDKRRLATFALIVGFLVDVITFRNINLDTSVIILSANLAVVAGSILILSLPRHESESRVFGQILSWVPVLHQYSTGALLSAFLVLYSASSSLLASWPFLLIVLIAAVGNERIHLQKYKLPFQTSLFFLNLLLFFTLAVPIAIDSIGATTFILSMFVASIVFIIFIKFGRVVAHYAFKTNNAGIRTGWVAVLGLIVFLYFTNLIPPIPLSVKDIGVYHEVYKSGDSYIAKDETRSLFERFFDINGVTLRLKEGEDAYVYSAVFAPGELDTTIVHKWEFFNEVTDKWVTTNRVHFPISGGREGGYRGYSFSENSEEGKWRVSVQTKGGQVIGRTYIIVEKVVNKRSIFEETI